MFSMASIAQRVLKLSICEIGEELTFVRRLSPEQKPQHQMKLTEFNCTLDSFPRKTNFPLSLRSRHSASNTSPSISFTHRLVPAATKPAASSDVLAALSLPSHTYCHVPVAPVPAAPYQLLCNCRHFPAVLSLAQPLGPPPPSYLVRTVIPSPISPPPKPLPNVGISYARCGSSAGVRAGVPKS